MVATLPEHIDVLRDSPAEVSGLLKTLSHPNRLLIACQLLEGEQSVSEIERRAGVKQPILSRDLARLRDEGLVATRRQSKMIYYRISDERLVRLVTALCSAFAPETEKNDAS